MAAAEKVVQFAVVGQTMTALTSEGRLFERRPDPRDFNQGPHHRPAYLWAEIKGPLAE